jgi:hypothetical protein
MVALRREGKGGSVGRLPGDFRRPERLEAALDGVSLGERALARCLQLGEVTIEQAAQPAAHLGDPLGDLAPRGDLRLDLLLLLGQACDLPTQLSQLPRRLLQLGRCEAERAAPVGQRGQNLLQLPLPFRQLTLHRTRLILHLLQLMFGSPCLTFDRNEALLVLTEQGQALVQPDEDVGDIPLLGLHLFVEGAELSLQSCHLALTLTERPETSIQTCARIVEPALERLEVLLPLRDRLIGAGQFLLTLAKRGEALVEGLGRVRELAPDRLEIAGRLLGIGERRLHLGGLGLELLVRALQFLMLGLRAGQCLSAVASSDRS